MVFRAVVRARERRSDRIRNHIFVAGVNDAGKSERLGLIWTTWSTNVIHADEHGLEVRPVRPGLGQPRQRTVPASTSRTKNGTAGRAARVQDPASRRDAVSMRWTPRCRTETRVNVGSQDKNSLKTRKNENTVNGDRIPYVGGDGMMNRIDLTNQGKFYGCSQTAAAAA